MAGAETSGFHAGVLTPADTVNACLTAGVSTWWQITAFIRVAGPDALTLLENVTTRAFPVDRADGAVFGLMLTPRAQIVAAFVAYRTGESEVLLELAPDRVDDAIAHLTRYRLRSNVDIERAERASVSVVGPASADRTGDGWFSTPVFVVPAMTFVGEPKAVSQLVSVDLPAAGFPHADPIALDAVRIAGGVPGLSDMVPGRMPAEVGAVPVAVDLDKGCYVGQEPVARLHWRGRANRTLRTVSLSGPVPDGYGSEEGFDGDSYLMLEWTPDGELPRRVGQLTSWAWSPIHGWIGLAIVRREVPTGARLDLVGTAITVEVCHPVMAAG